MSLAEGMEKLSLPHFNENLFSSYSWLKVIIDTYKLNFFIKYIEQGGAVRSYIIYAVIENVWERKICVCSYCDYFDCHVHSQKDWELFLKVLELEYPSYRIAIRNLNDEFARKVDKFQTLSKERHHLMDIRDDLDALWQSSFSSFRNAYRQALRHGLVVRQCSYKHLSLFYQLHLKLRKTKYRLFPQPFKFFRNIWQQFIENDRGVLLGAFDRAGNLVAANMYLICTNTLYYKFNTSSLEALKKRPNNLLMWEGIKFAKERGLEYVDLGSSGCYQDGLISFKKHIVQKTIESDITHLGYIPPGYQCSKKKFFKCYTRFFTSPWVPNGLVKLGSHLIYPYLA